MDNECRECKMKFETTEQLALHTKRVTKQPISHFFFFQFCVNSD